MKPIRSLLNEAETKMELWVEIAEDPQALTDRGKTKEQALHLASFFEGRFDGLCDALPLVVEMKKRG